MFPLSSIWEQWSLTFKSRIHVTAWKTLILECVLPGTSILDSASEKPCWIFISYIKKKSWNLWYCTCHLKIRCQRAVVSEDSGSRLDHDLCKLGYRLQTFRDKPWSCLRCSTHGNPWRVSIALIDFQYRRSQPTNVFKEKNSRKLLPGPGRDGGFRIPIGFFLVPCSTCATLLCSLLQHPLRARFKLLSHIYWTGCSLPRDWKNLLQYPNTGNIIQALGNALRRLGEVQRTAVSMFSSHTGQYTHT